MWCYNVHYAEKRSEMRKESVREDHVMTTVEEIQKLKKEKNAVILAHYYVDVYKRQSMMRMKFSICIPIS